MRKYIPFTLAIVLEFVLLYVAYYCYTSLPMYPFGWFGAGAFIMSWIVPIGIGEEWDTLKRKIREQDNTARRHITINIKESSIMRHIRTNPMAWTFMVINTIVLVVSDEILDLPWPITLWNHCMTNLALIIAAYVWTQHLSPEAKALTSKINYIKWWISKDEVVAECAVLLGKNAWDELDIIITHLSEDNFLPQDRKCIICDSWLSDDHIGYRLNTILDLAKRNVEARNMKQYIINNADLY